MKLQKSHAAALAVAGLLAVTAATPSVARDRGWGAAGAGFAAGAIVGAAAANSNAYYGGPGYYYGPGYGYQPYAYDYAPVDSYAYVPAAPAYSYSYAPSYNPEQPYDPDPRIGGSVRMNSDD